MISKELLSAVLGREVKKVIKVEQKDVIGLLTFKVLRFETPYGDMRSISIHELAHKCKEWAMSKGYVLLTVGGMYYNCYVHYTTNKSEWGNRANECSASTEPEAIFKACEWVLENS